MSDPSTPPKAERLKAPFPWFGGKRRVAHIVWERFGNPPNYVEPCVGSMAVPLGRPRKPKNETVNDLDCYIANFWRAAQHDPDAVAAAADWPVNEADLHARHRWLHAQEEFRERMHTEKDFYDAEVAGIWVWGISCWIGDNWCRTTPQRSAPSSQAMSRGVTAFRGDGTGLDRRRPDLPGSGVHQAGLQNKRPQLKRGNAGVHSGRASGPATGFENTRPNLRAGGVHSQRARGPGESRQLPDISGDGGASGRGIHAKYASRLYDYMRRLAERLRYVRVCCGDWSRVLGPSPTVHIGVTAVFLDPPYSDPGRHKVYNEESRTVAPAMREWCKEHGDEPKLRIALCGYEGEHEELEGLGWDVVAWKAAGGYAARNPENRNAWRERIWFSPHCLKARQGKLAFKEPGA